VVKQKAFAPVAMPFGEALAGESGVGEVKVEFDGRGITRLHEAKRGRQGKPGGTTLREQGAAPLNIELRRLDVI